MMRTRCPACSTLFRINAEQLRARQGNVRCGRCRQVFNALENLSSESNVISPEAKTGAFEPTPSPMGRPEELMAAASAPSGGSTAPQGRAWGASPWPWVVGLFIAILVLILQAAIHFRAELAVAFPETRPALEALCEPLGYEIGLPHDVERLGIEVSSLHPNPKLAGKLQLTATLRNHAPFAQTLPHLELTLTDIDDKALVRKVIEPADYLPGSMTPEEGFPANGEIEIRLALDSDSLSAVGYRLYLFYP